VYRRGPNRKIGSQPPSPARLKAVQVTGNREIPVDQKLGLLKRDELYLLQSSPFKHNHRSWAIIYNFCGYKLFSNIVHLSTNNIWFNKKAYVRESGCVDTGCTKQEHGGKILAAAMDGGGDVWVRGPVSKVIDRVPETLCDRKRMRGIPFRAPVAARVCLPGLW
jgi:hypothetical protein